MKPVTILFLALCLSITNSFAQTQTMKAHFIDMGQGLATILQFPRGIVMIDAGAQIKSGKEKSQAKVLKYLNEFFKANTQYKWTIDALIITHNHSDHFASILPIYEGGKITIKSIVTTRHHVDNAEDVATLIADPNIRHFFVEYSDVISKSPNGVTNADIDPLPDFNGVDPEIRIFSGRNKDWEAADMYDNPNFHSLGVRVKFGAASFLFVGDMEKPSQKFMLEKHLGHEDVFDVDVYQVGHHGSGNATSRELMAAMSPKLAIISASGRKDKSSGSGYSYGHPNDSIISLLERSVTATRKPKKGFVYHGGKNITDKTINAGIYCTCWDKTVVVEATSGGQYTIK